MCWNICIYIYHMSNYVYIYIYVYILNLTKTHIVDILFNVLCMISSEQDHQSICIHQPGPEPPASASQQTLPPEQFINVEVILLEWYTYMWHTYYWNDCCWNNVPQICILHTVQIWASDILYMCMFFHVFHICAARRKICILALRTINLAWGHCMTSVLRNTIRKARRQRLLFLAFPANTKESRWLSDASSDIGPGGTTDQTLRESKRTTHHTVRNPTAQCKDLRATQLLLWFFLLLCFPSVVWLTWNFDGGV
jgi:hypothetical protein